jgi:hypothetical protein
LWFNRQRREEEVSEETVPQHPEHVYYEDGSEVTAESLDRLDDETLWFIAAQCPVDVVAAEDCLACLANAIAADRQQQRNGQSSASPGEEEIPFELPGLKEAVETPFTEDEVTRLTGDPEWEPPGGDARHADPAKEFARQVGYLQSLVDEMLSGPPIPPRDVSLEELAALVVGSRKWLDMTQGLDLAPATQAMRDEIQRVVEKVQRG